jgi:hypothetical protein
VPTNHKLPAGGQKPKPGLLVTRLVVQSFERFGTVPVPQFAKTNLRKPWSKWQKRRTVSRHCSSTPNCHNHLFGWIFLSVLLAGGFALSVCSCSDRRILCMALRTKRVSASTKASRSSPTRRPRKHKCKQIVKSTGWPMCRIVSIVASVSKLFRGVGLSTSESSRLGRCAPPHSDTHHPFLTHRLAERPSLVVGTVLPQNLLIADEPAPLSAD